MNPAVLGIVGSVLGAAIGALVAGYFVMQSHAVQVRRDLKLRCYETFLKFHATMSAVVAEYAPAADTGWHDAYLERRKALELIADDLIPLVHLVISEQVAEKVHALRVEFRKWEGHVILSQAKLMPPDERVQAHRELVQHHPRRLKELLDGLTSEFRAALEGPL